MGQIKMPVSGGGTLSATFVTAINGYTATVPFTANNGDLICAFTSSTDSRTVGTCSISGTTSTTLIISSCVWSSAYVFRVGGNGYLIKSNSATNGTSGLIVVKISTQH